MAEVTEKTDELDLIVWEDVREENVVEYVRLLRAEMEKFGNWIHRETQKRMALKSDWDSRNNIRKKYGQHGRSRLKVFRCRTTGCCARLRHSRERSARIKNDKHTRFYFA